MYRELTNRIGFLFLVASPVLLLVGCGAPSDSAGIPQQVLDQRARYEATPWPSTGTKANPALVVVTPPPPTRQPWQEMIGTVKPYREWDLHETAIDSLGRIGAPAVDRLATILRHPDAAYRAQAARILARIGPDAAPAVPALIHALGDSHPQVRKEATHALGQIGPAAQDAIDALIQVVEQSDAGDIQPAYLP